jgi:hypothetical protein
MLLIPIISAVEIQESSNNDFQEFKEITPRYHFVPVTIRGTGYIYSALYYISIIPMVIIDFIMLFFELFGISGNLTILIWNIFHNYIPDFIRDLSDLRESVFSVFLMCPFINVIQVSGSFQLGDDNGFCFNGDLLGFTGIAWEFNNNIFIKGFAVTVNY